MNIYCKHCQDPVDIELPHISMVGWGFAKTKNMEICFHEKCFEEVAGDEYFKTLAATKVDPEGRPVGDLAQEMCQNCLKRPVDQTRKHKGVPYCSVCPQPGMECHTLDCDKPRKMSSYYCIDCIEVHSGTRRTSP